MRRFLTEKHSYKDLPTLNVVGGSMKSFVDYTYIQFMKLDEYAKHIQIIKPSYEALSPPYRCCSCKLQELVKSMK